MLQKLNNSLDKITKFEEISCPICSSHTYNEIYCRDYNIWCNGVEYLWQAQQVVCTLCGMIFTNPQPSDDIIHWFYEGDLRFGIYPGYFREKQLAFFERYTKKHSTLFDIGAYNGDFLYLAQKKGYKIFGIEPAAEAVDEAREKYDINIHKGFFDKTFVKKYPRQYDVITIRHVLEHVKDPIEFLRLAMKITQPGGYIYIEVPDASNPFVSNIADFFSLQHLQYFTPKSLQNITAVTGITMVAMEQINEPPILRVLIKNEHSSQKIVNEYEINRNLIKNYDKKRQKFLSQLRSRINSNVTQVAIYGAGSHTLQLLQLGLLKGINVNKIIDSNPKKWGTLFEGLHVEKPEDLKDIRYPVLISSYDFQEEISESLSKQFPHLEQIKLYDNVVSYNMSKTQ